jgi:amino acid transporter
MRLVDRNAPVAPPRELGRGSLLFLSVGAVIGSGWLFAALDAGQRAGGSSVLAWVVAGGLVTSIALVYAELGTMFPVDAGTARFPLYGFGRVTGFLSGWFTWLGTVCIAPIETEAALRYAGNYVPALTTLDGRSVVLTVVGKVAAAVILLGFTVLNAFGLRLFKETNAVVVCWKILIPLLVALAFLCTRFDPHNFVVGGFFAGGIHGVFLATSSGGVIFALIGFEQAVELGGETKEPQRSIPWAVIGAVIIGGGLYLVLQIAFVGVVPARFLSQGWLHVGFHGIFGPYAGLATAVGLSVIAYLIYSDAIISPAGTALTYTTTSSRVPYVMALEGFLPRRLSRLSTREVPLLSLGLCYVASVVIILVFPKWEELLQFVTAAVVLMYALAPLALGVIRATGPELRRPYRLRHPGLTAPVAFVVANFLLLWTGWSTLSKLFSVVGVGVVALIGLAILRPHFRHSIHEWWAASWLVPYVAGMALISALGPFGGGEKSPDRQWLYMAICAAFSLALYYLAVYLGTRACRRLPEGDRPLDRWHRTEQRMHEAAAAASRDEPAPLRFDPGPDGG